MFQQAATIDVTPVYTFQDLQQELARIRGSMPRRTLYHWLSTLGIYTNLEGYYEASDLEILKQLNRYLKQTPNIRKFKATLQKRGSYYADGF